MFLSVPPGSSAVDFPLLRNSVYNQSVSYINDRIKSKSFEKNLLISHKKYYLILFSIKICVNWIISKFHQKRSAISY
jgi:hypothetical protein